MSENQPLTTGYYLGIRRAIRNFSFTVPKLGQGVTDTDMDKWFNQLNSGRREQKPTPKREKGLEKSTSFSGWIKTDNAVNLSQKCLVAPEIYKAAGGDDYLLAQEKVKQFKKKASEVLSRCVKTQEAITEATAAEINACACVVSEIRVIILCVKDTEQPGFRFDPNTNQYYREKTVRKFYLSTVPLDELLETFAQELADPETTVNAEQKLVAVRINRTTQDEHGNSKTVSSFGIRSATDQEIMATNAALLAAVQRIKAKLMT